MENEKVKTSAAEIWVEDENILMVKIVSRTLTIKDFEEIGIVGEKLRKEKIKGNLYTIADVSSISWVDAEARKYVVKMPGLENSKGTALVYNNPVARIISSFFLAVNKTKRVVIKAFKTVEEAKNWIKKREQELNEISQ